MNKMDIFSQLVNSGSGTYLIRESGLVNYSDRWAYGYAVGLRPMEFEDIVPSALVGVWEDIVGARHYDVVQHVDAIQDAVNMARDNSQQAIYDFYEGRVISV